MSKKVNTLGGKIGNGHRERHTETRPVSSKVTVVIQARSDGRSENERRGNHLGFLSHALLTF